MLIFLNIFLFINLILNNCHAMEMGTAPTYAPTQQAYKAMCDLSVALKVISTTWLCASGIPLTSVCSASTSTWTGVTCVSGKVTNIVLTISSLRGTIPSSIGYLTDLQSLYLNANSLTGTLPSSLGLATSLSAMNVGFNKLTGTVPTQIGLLTKLTFLAMFSNSFSGSVPSSLCSATALGTLSISSTRFSCYSSCLSTVTTRTVGTVTMCTSSPTAAPTSLVCPNIRYARIDATSNYLQISQLAVYNTAGSNVALQKRTFASQVYVGDSCTYYSSGAVDGQLTTKTFYSCSNITYLSASNTGAYLKVDLGSSQSINKVVYYNRKDSGYNSRSSSYFISLLDASNITVCQSSTLSTAFIQDVPLYNAPTVLPTISPTMKPTTQPSNNPSNPPTKVPSFQPSVAPTVTPSQAPTVLPTISPTMKPTTQPSNNPSNPPTKEPSFRPSLAPTSSPSQVPTKVPTAAPTIMMNSVLCDLSAAMQVADSSWTCTDGNPNTPICTGSNSGWTNVVCLDGIVTSLSIFNVGSPATIPSSIGRLTTLNTLVLANWPITGTIPSSIGLLSSLTALYFSSTSISGTIPTELGYLTDMEHLNFDTSLITGPIPKSFCTLTKLRYLTIYSSSVTCYWSCLSPIISGLTVVYYYAFQVSGYSGLASCTDAPTRSPTKSVSPTKVPTRIPSIAPTTFTPTKGPTSTPSKTPTTIPSFVPTQFPTMQPTYQPSFIPTVQPSVIPSAQPSTIPSSVPSSQPSQPTVLPTVLPSSLPTVSPTSSPTASPSDSPTTAPTLIPTSLPTTTPTNLPSNAPTASPTSSPTASPTTLPSSSPTIIPTTLPTTIPTDIPSNSPTVMPTDIPTEIPTTAPTVLPSTIPTDLPTSSPTVLPTTTPTIVPTTVPTVAPSVTPTSSPTSAPTSRPSIMPTSTPTDLPTSSPSVLPTTTPTSLPTVLPTVIPSVIPTTLPTSTPTYRPSVLPTRIPTSKPSLQPITVTPSSVPVMPPTSIPTMTGATNPPTVIPSSQPTWNLLDYKSKPIYKSEYTPLVNHTTVRTTRKIFSSFTYKGYVKEGGGCSNWNSFSRNTLDIVVNSYYYSSIIATFGYTHFLSGRHSNVTATCSTAGVVTGIVNSIKSKAITSTYPDYTMMCSGYVWKVFTCNSAPVLCVNCSGDCTCPGLSTYLTSSCGSSCLSNSASYTHLVFDMKQRVLYPRLTIWDLTTGRTSVEINMTLSGTGKVYCQAVTANTTLTSVYSIWQYGSSLVSLDATKNLTLWLSGLSPSSYYDIYCYTEDSSGNGMDLAAVIATKHQVVTSCCPAAVFTAVYSKIVEYSSDFTAADSSVFSLALEKIPQYRQTVKISVVNVPCTNGNIYATTGHAVPYPSTFIFTNISHLLSQNFVIHGTPGCYEIVASGYNLQNSSSSLYIYNTSTTVSPSVKSAYFSSDGSSVYVFFDIATNYGKTVIPNYSSEFACNLLLLFKGSTSFTCKWLTNKLVFAYLTQKATETPSIGDTVQLVAGVVDSNCIGKVCSAAVSSPTITISLPTDPVNPSAALSAPSIISSCSDIILDPTASIGQGLKDWSNIQWYVSSSDFDTLLIYDWLNKYHNSTSNTITLSNSYLQTGTIIFTLYLTNFMGLSSFATATVVISSSSDIPYTTISGSSTVSLYRWQDLLLFASSTVSNCATTSTNTTSSALSYSWKVYQGLTYQSTLPSSSLNPRYFKLSGYSLGSLTQYTVQVTTTNVATGSFSSASVSVYVKRSSILATISGGTKRVVSSLSPFTLDASSTYDQDYPTTNLSYTWSCSVLYPVFGDSCGNIVIPKLATVTIAAHTLSAKNYNFSVAVSSIDGLVATTSVTILVVDSPIPSLTFNNIKQKYNPEDRIILGVNIVATDLITTVWSCPGCQMNLSNIALTPLMTGFGTGNILVQLSLESNAFQSNLAYTLQLSSSYYNSTLPVTSYVQVIVAINAPPVQGVLTVMPVTGYVLTTSFYLNTYGWIDDASDYPLSYTMTYYTSDTTSTNLILSSGSRQYTSAVIGQGLSSNNYSVTCIATAEDIYGCSNEISKAIRVLPVVSAEALQTSMLNQLTLASQTSNTELTMQTVSAVCTSLNAAKCSAAPDCTLLNRSSCDTVTNTCGPCLTGYLGVSGYANTGCRLPRDLRNTGETCSSNSECVSYNCQSNICTTSVKACPNNCSGNGDCQYYDSNGNKIASCDANSYLCKAKCNCHSNRFGFECSFTSSQFSIRRSMREAMCVQLYNILDIQDVTSDVIVGRATALSALLLDPTQLTTYALSNCTLALTTTIQQYPSICAEDSVYLDVISSLSSIIENGKVLANTVISSALSTQVSSAIDILLEERQLLLAVNEESSVVTDNLRMYSTVKYKSDLVAQLFSLPQSDLEIFTKVNPAQVTIGSSTSTNTAITRLSLSQSNLNYRNATTDASIVKLQLNYDAITAITTATVFLQNYKKLEYHKSISYNTTVFCSTASVPYNKSANCSADPLLTVYCPGTTERTVTATCPGHQSLPACQSWDGAQYNKDSDCQQVSYSPYNTTCECSGTTSYISRRQLGTIARADSTASGGNSGGSGSSGGSSGSGGNVEASQIVGEFSATAIIITQAFVSTWTSAASLDASSIADNYYITLTVSLIAAFFILGFINILCKKHLFPDKAEEDAKDVKSVTDAEQLSLENAKALFDSILPVEFKFRPWYSNFWIKLVECHPHLAYFAPARGRRMYHTKMWLCFCFEILFFIFMDSIFSPLANADDSTCAAYLTESSCTQPLSFDISDKLCYWDEETETCYYNVPSESFAITMIVVLVASICSQPPSMLAEYLIEKATARTEAEIMEEEGIEGEEVVVGNGNENEGEKVEEIQQTDSHFEKDTIQQHRRFSSSIVPVAIPVEANGGKADAADGNIDPPEKKPRRASKKVVPLDDELVRHLSQPPAEDGRKASIINNNTNNNNHRNNNYSKCTKNDHNESAQHKIMSTPPSENSEVLQQDFVLQDMDEYGDNNKSTNTQDLYNHDGQYLMNDDLVVSRKPSGASSHINMKYNNNQINEVDSDSDNDEVDAVAPLEEPIIPKEEEEEKKQDQAEGKKEEENRILRDHVQQFQGRIADVTKVQHHDKNNNNHIGEQTLMTVSSMMMLAARLVLLQQHMDTSTPEEELSYMLEESKEMYETDIIAEAITTISLLRSITNYHYTNTVEQQKQYTEKMHKKVLTKILHVRARAATIVEELHEMESDEKKEKYLLKRFIVELKKGVYKKVIFRHFFELEEDEEEGDTVHWLIRALSIFMLFLLAFGCLFYILLTGISLGQPTTILWLEVLAIGLIQDVLLLKPLGIWFRFIAIASIVSESVRHVTTLVHDRVHLIMRRTHGMVRHNSLLVQHFNAACRAARAFPHLQTSRLLIALNDYDLPKSLLPNKRRFLKLFLDILFLTFVLAILLLTLMPELFQEIIIEASMTAFINFPIYALLLLANLNIALPVLAVILVLILLSIREYIVRRQRRKELLRLKRKEENILQRRRSSLHKGMV